MLCTVSSSANSQVTKKELNLEPTFSEFLNLGLESADVLAITSGASFRNVQVISIKKNRAMKRSAIHEFDGPYYRFITEALEEDHETVAIIAPTPNHRIVCLGIAAIIIQSVLSKARI